MVMMMKRLASVFGVWLFFVMAIFSAILLYISTGSDIFLYITVGVFFLAAVLVNYMMVFGRASTTGSNGAGGSKKPKMKISFLAKTFLAYLIISFILIFMIFVLWALFVSNIDVSPKILFEYLQSSAIYAAPFALIILIASIFSRK